MILIFDSNFKIWVVKKHLKSLVDRVLINLSIIKWNICAVNCNYL